MSTSRRQFIRTATAATAAAAGGAMGIIDPAAAAAADLASTAPVPRPGQAPRRIRLLILGGTGFIGPHQVRYAVERGHTVTIFNRGSNPGMFPGVEEVTGDRAVNNYESLKGRRWDAVIDNSAAAGPTAEQWVRDACAVLRDNVEQYLFISTRSVYRDLSMVPATVDAPVYTPANPPTGWEQGEDMPYGLGKAQAEKQARAAFGDRTTIVRPGLIVGPGDETERFTYWPLRIERGGEVLAPGEPEVDRIQVIDVRDLCDWCVRLCEQRTYGTFMGVGPQNGRSIAEFLYGIAAVTSAPLSWTWVPREFLESHNIRGYRELPVWQPPVPGREGFARFDLTREVAAGLTFRTLADTTLATLEYQHARSAEEQVLPRSFLTPEREREVLAAWHASRRR